MKLLRSAAALEDSHVDILDHLYLFLDLKAAGKIDWLKIAASPPYNFPHLRRRLPSAAGGEFVAFCPSVVKNASKKVNQWRRWQSFLPGSLGSFGVYLKTILSCCACAAYCRDDNMPTKTIALLTVCFLSSPGIIFHSSPILGGFFMRRLSSKVSRVSRPPLIVLLRIQFSKLKVPDTVWFLLDCTRVLLRYYILFILKQ